MTAPTPVPDRTDWVYVSQNSNDVPFGVQIYLAGALSDADNGVVTVSMDNADGNTQAFIREALHPGTGQYNIVLSAADTSIPGYYYLRFSWTVGGNDDFYQWPIEIGQAAPAYDQLPFAAQQVVENVYIKFADLYDSPHGGPHLKVYLQSKFGRGRIAQLLRTAMQKLNTTAQPTGNYDLTTFPYDGWGGLIEQGLYIEIIRHLIRTYTEQPEVILGTALSRTDRRDYMQRWQSVLEMEMTDYTDMLGNWKMANMFLGKPSVLVSGGAYGRWGPIAMPGGYGEAAARGYFAVRGF